MPALRQPIPIQAVGGHALCAPSSADRWMHCAGSVAMEQGEPDTTSDAAEEGTLAHSYLQQWLVTSNAPAALLENAEMHAALRLVVEYIYKIEQSARHEGATVTTLAERRLPLEEVTGERGAFGTADVIIILRFKDRCDLHVIDLKYGRGVEVDDDTLQLPVYALAAVAQYGLMDDFQTIVTTVAQPRLRSEFTPVVWDLAALRAFGEKVMMRAQEVLSIVAQPGTATSNLTVTEKGCRWCKAQYKCPAKAKQVHDTVYGEIQDLTQEGIQPIDEVSFVGAPADFANLLPVFMRRVPEIEAWCKYVRVKVEQLLVDGKPVQGFKLVMGRMGARAWTSQDAVLPVLKYANIPRELVMTLPELRTPADLEKKLKKAYPNVWNSLQGFIVQAPGKPSVAPENDPRPSYAGAAFDGESYSAEDLV